jgi:phosphatidylserine/phosphatidylglycerophosphate/cardiolipin synthase-like enzyme
MRKKVAFKCLVPVLILALLLSPYWACGVMGRSPIIAIHQSRAYTSPDKTVPPPLIITEVYPDTATKNELDEYLTITNPCVHPVNIEGWSITDGEGTIIFPPFELSQNQTIYVTRNASAFVAQMTVANKAIYPDFEYGSDSDPTVSQMQTQGRAFALRNTGDEVILHDKSGREVDVVIYGDSSYEGAGWSGEPLEKPREGMIVRRKGIQDTNQCEDWLALPFGSSYHAPEKFFLYSDVTAFVSPDCTFFMLQREIENATSSLQINLYQFENPHLMDSMVDALNRGVDVCLLLEGSPVGGITDEERYIAEMIAERGGTVRLSHDQYLNHAKYAVIDDKTVIVMTENWGSTGVPLNNSFGNRGWGIVLKNEVVANYFKGVFFEDFYRGKEFEPEMKDLEPNVINRSIPQGSYVPVFEPWTVTCNLTVIPVLAPDTALSNETILGAINSAQESILVQQFSAGRFWGEAANPFITALIEAARRGCEVNVLLDSNDYNLDAWNDNDEAVAWMNEVASEANLNLEAKLVDLDSLGLIKLHTKGLIVDGKVVIITSLNWNANSIHNREAGVIVENEEIASFYEDVFFHDWNASVKREGGAESEEGAPGITMKVVAVAVTLILSFVIFRIVKWYKRL